MSVYSLLLHSSSCILVASPCSQHRCLCRAPCRMSTNGTFSYVRCDHPVRMHCVFCDWWRILGGSRADASRSVWVADVCWSAATTIACSGADLLVMGHHSLHHQRHRVWYHDLQRLFRFLPISHGTVSLTVGPAFVYRWDRQCSLESAV